MNSNWKINKEGEKSESNIYYLMTDILACFPDRFEDHFLGTINHHLIAKETIRKILIDEVKKQKPEFRILSGALILQNVFLRQMQRSAIYEVIDVLEPIKICLKSNFKIIKKLANEILLRFFTILYFEYIFMPGRKEEGKEYIKKFKNIFSIDNVIEAIETQGVFPRFIFENHMKGIDYEGKTNMTYSKLIKDFYEN